MEVRESGHTNLVFEKAARPSCLIRTHRVSEDDSFSSLIHDILKYPFEMIGVLTHFIGCQFDVFVHGSLKFFS